VRALSILGLEEGAEKETIRMAYMHLAKVHHPDKYEHLGDQARTTANHIFTRINLAYEYLTKS
jgi:DnaJ-class molecular chaperone